MEKPNIILITTDQQRFDTIGALGNREIFTPHLNWLVDEGITFHNCYSSCPVCMPARATIMTGKDGTTHGLTGNFEHCMPMKENETFPSVLTRNGYQTRAEGKLHFYPMRTYYGIEHADLPMDYFNECRRLGKPSTRLHGVGENEMEPVINMMEERDTLTHWIVGKSMDFLENHDPERPYFLWTSFPKPHPPLDPLLSYWRLYENMDISAPVYGGWSQDIEKIPKGFYKATAQLNHVERMSPQQIQQIKKAYYACITQIDYNLGFLFAKMRELNLLENTWIIFTSDHGEMLGDHHMGAKSVFLEGSSHVPMIIKPPASFGKSHPEYHGITCDNLVTLADVMPTILELCEIPYEKPLDGVSMMKILRDKNSRTFYGNCEDKYLAIMKNKYKYLWTWYGGQELLFNLNEDCMEQRNLADRKEYQDILNGLKSDLLEFVQEKSPHMLKENRLICGPEITSLHEISRFPGFNTTVFPRDSFH